MSMFSNVFGSNPKEPQRKDIKRKPVQQRGFKRNNQLDDQLIKKETDQEHKQLVNTNEYLHSLQSDHDQFYG